MNYKFDLIILTFLIMDGALAVMLALHLKARGREYSRWYVRTGIVLATLGWLVVFYGSFIEPQIIIVREEVVNLNTVGSETTGETTANVSPSIRAVLIGDIHLGPYKKIAFAERVVTRVNALESDIIFLVGDFVYDNRNQTEYLEPLKNLSAPLGVYAVLGNHDYGETVRQKLEALGIDVLVNEGVIMKIGAAGKDDTGINLLGVDDLWFGKSDIAEALRDIGLESVAQSANSTILITHNPDVIRDAVEKKIDFVAASHTHGGQIRLPFLGPTAEIPDKLGQKFDKGLFEFGETQLYITSGLGESGPRARLFNPPEIVVLKINF